MITFQEESMRKALPDASKLLIDHWKELANHQEDRPLNPDFDKYIQMNEAGFIRLFTVRDDEKLIGYASFIVADNLHYKDWKYASCDIYYLDREYRNKGTGLQMFTEIENWLKSIGVKSVVLHEKVDQPHGKMFEALGFKLIERYYEKVI